MVRRHAIGPVVIAYSAAVGACEERQQHQQALHPLRARLSQAIVPAEVTSRAAISVCTRGPQHQQASHLPRERQRYAIWSDVATYSAAE